MDYFAYRRDAINWNSTEQLLVSHFPIINVSELRSEDLEQLGTKPKYWYRDDAGRRMMFKAENRQTGEDWAERIACEFCEHLGIPHVHYELAFDTFQELPGVICENIASKPRSLILGNQLMLEIDASYPADHERRYKVSAHTVSAVHKVVSRLELPAYDGALALPPEITSATGVFIAFIMLDALIANQDRHHQPWGAVRGAQTRLAPTFDHGAALARNEPEEKRQRRLEAGDAERQMLTFANRARSAFYRERTDTRTLGTLEAFEAFADLDADAANAWLSRLRGFSVEEITAIVDRVPDSRISDTARSFTIKLVQLNRMRLLDNIDKR